MANRYWVGGAGTWDTTSTANWSTTSGGAAGASAPTTADVAIFDAASGSTYTVTLGENVSVNTVTATSAVSATVDFGTYKITLVGNGAAIWAAAGFTSYLGTPLIECSYSGATGTRTIIAGGDASNRPSFNITAGTDLLSMGGGRVFGTINFTGFSGTLLDGNRSIVGDYIASATMTFQAGPSGTTFASTSGIRTITANGNTFTGTFNFSGPGGSWKFTDNFSLATANTLTLTSGTLDADGKNVSIGNFSLGSGTKTLTLGSGTWTVTGTSWNANTNVAALTVSSSAGTISMTSASAKTFAGGGKVWPTLNQGGAGALTIQQSNTFANITNTVQPATITLTSGTTQTVTDFDVSGTSGNLVTLNASTAGTQATLTDSSGTNSVSFVDIKDIVATGGAEWQSYTTNGNVNSGNNTGWIFDAPAILGDEYVTELRSFTEKRRF
jgi:hypothetical protein